MFWIRYQIIKLYMAVMGLLVSLEKAEWTNSEENVSFKITYYVSISTDYINWHLKKIIKLNEYKEWNSYYWLKVIRF